MSDLIDRRKALDELKYEMKYGAVIDQCGLDTAYDIIKDLPSAELEHKAPISFEEQLSLDCSFCRQHECGDTLYESADWDGGVSFDYVRDIRFCPICGRELYGYEDEERRKNE